MQEVEHLFSRLDRPVEILFGLFRVLEKKRLVQEYHELPDALDEVSPRLLERVRH